MCTKTPIVQRNVNKMPAASFGPPGAFGSQLMINGMECLATIPRNHPNHPDHPEGPSIHRLGGHTSPHTISRSLSSFGLAASAAFSASRRSGATVIVGSWCCKPSSHKQISRVSQFDCPSRPRCNIYVVISREIAFWYQGILVSRSNSILLCSHLLVERFLRVIWKTEHLWWRCVHHHRSSSA